MKLSGVLAVPLVLAAAGAAGLVLYLQSEGVTPRALPISETFSDIGATLAKHLGVQPTLHGTALL